MSKIVSEILAVMKTKSDFPALSSTIATLAEELRHENVNVMKLVQIVLSDTSLTKKVLKLANSPMYAQFGYEVDSVSMAIKILGIDAVGHLALNSVVLNAFTGSSSDEANTEMNKVSLANELAYSLNAGTTPEMNTLAVSLSNIGRLSVVFFLPERWQDILDLVKRGASEEDAAKTVLGLTLEELGGELSAQWGFPDSLVGLAKKEFTGDLENITEFCLEVANKTIDANSPLSSEELLNVAATHKIELNEEDLDNKLALINNEKAKRVTEKHHRYHRVEDDEETLDSIIQKFNGSYKDLNTIAPLIIKEMDIFKPSMVVVFSATDQENMYSVTHGKGPLFFRYKKYIMNTSAVNLIRVSLEKNADIYLQDITKTGAVSSEFKNDFPNARSICIMPFKAGKISSFVYLEWGHTNPIVAEDVAKLREYRNKILEKVKSYKQ